MSSPSISIPSRYKAGGFRVHPRFVGKRSCSSRRTRREQRVPIKKGAGIVDKRYRWASEMYPEYLLCICDTLCRYYASASLWVVSGLHPQVMAHRPDRQNEPGEKDWRLGWENRWGGMGWDGIQWAGTYSILLLPTLLPNLDPCSSTIPHPHCTPNPTPTLPARRLFFNELQIPAAPPPNSLPPLVNNQESKDHSYTHTRPVSLKQQWTDCNISALLAIIIIIIIININIVISVTAGLFCFYLPDIYFPRQKLSPFLALSHYYGCHDHQSRRATILASRTDDDLTLSFRSQIPSGHHTSTIPFLLISTGSSVSDRDLYKEVTQTSAAIVSSRQYHLLTGPTRSDDSFAKQQPTL